MKTKAERKEEAYAKYEYEKERARYKAWIKLQKKIKEIDEAD